MSWGVNDMNKSPRESVRPAASPETGKENSPVVKLEDLNLADLPWQQSAESTEAQGLVKLQVGENKYNLAYDRTVETNPVSTYNGEVFYVLPEEELPPKTSRARVKRCHIWFRVGLVLRPNTGEATTGIFRNPLLRPGDKMYMREGAGAELYKKILGYLQVSAIKLNKPIHHRVTRKPGSETMPMSVEKWNEIFAPILTGLGYKPSSAGDIWTKTYMPAGVSGES